MNIGSGKLLYEHKKKNIATTEREKQAIWDFKISTFGIAYVLFFSTNSWLIYILICGKNRDKMAFAEIVNNLTDY